MWAGQGVVLPLLPYALVGIVLGVFAPEVFVVPLIAFYQHGGIGRVRSYSKTYVVFGTKIHYFLCGCDILLAYHIC